MERPRWNFCCLSQNGGLNLRELSPTDLRIAPSDTGARDLLRRSNYGDFGRGGDPDLMPMGMMHVRHVLVAVAHRLLAMQVCVRLS